MSLENVVLLPFARRTPVGLRSLPSVLRTPSIHDDNTILFRLTISTRRRRSFIDNFAVPNMNRAEVHQCITYYWNSALYLGQHVYKLICTFCVVIRCASPRIKSYSVCVRGLNVRSPSDDFC